MREIRLSLPEPHRAQQKVIDGAKRFNVLCCGRRWGKTKFGIDRLMKPMLDGYEVGWFAPTNKQLAPAWRELQIVLKPVTLKKSERDHRLDLLSGGAIEMWSLDNDDVARGRKYKEAVIDEAALPCIDLQYNWQFVIRPTLTDYAGGAWFLSTPRGMNYFKTLFDRGNDPLRPTWASWQMPTAENPFISEAEIEEARKDLHELAFNQEYLAQFVNFEGTVFRRVIEAATATALEAPERGHEYVFGIDWGRSLDYTVVMIVDATARAVVHMQRWSTVDYAVQRDRIRTMYAHWRPALVIAESNAMGQPVIEQLFRDGVPVQPFLTTNASKTLAIEGLMMAFERCDIRVIPDPQLLAELQSFASSKLPSGLTRYEAPSGQHDDCVMALAIAWSAIDAYGPREQVITYEDREAISPY